VCDRSAVSVYSHGLEVHLMFMTSQLWCFIHRHASSSIFSLPSHPSVKDGAVPLIHSVREHYVG